MNYRYLHAFVNLLSNIKKQFQRDLDFLLLYRLKVNSLITCVIELSEMSTLKIGIFVIPPIRSLPIANRNGYF